MMTKVVNVKIQHIRPDYMNLKEWIKDENNVYIGRSGIVFIDGERYPKKTSIWANPFIVQKNRNENTIQLYENYIRNKIENEYGVEELLKLKGKTLGCWCKPKSCHGDVLIKLIEEYSRSNNEYEDSSSNDESDYLETLCLCCDENEIDTMCNFCEEKICEECITFCDICNSKCCPVCISKQNMCEVCQMKQ